MANLKLPKVDGWRFPQTEEDNFSHTWIIDNFLNDWRDERECPKFSCGSLEWILTVFPRVEAFNREYTSLSLSLVPSNKVGDARADVKMAILNDKLKEVHAIKRFLHDFCKTPKLDFDCFIERNTFYQDGNTFLPGGCLIIFCEIRLIVPVQHIHLKVASCTLIEDFNSLFENQKFSDVTICTSDREFHVHKAVLAARSPVFSAMFDHTMVENELNRVEINDIDPDVLEKLLRYIYTGIISNFEDMAGHLLMAADKYALERLKDMCTQTLCTSRLSVEKATETLILADLCSVIELKAKAMEFICRNASEILETPGFKALLTSHPHLVLETLAYSTQQILSTTLPSKK